MGTNVKEEVAIIKTNLGDMKINFYYDSAPNAIENFTTHAKNGYYDNLTFHRVIKDFMIQGGDPNGNGTGGESIWGNPFDDEFSNDARNYYGALSMANSGPNTNGSQFFIVQAKTVDDSLIEQMKESGLDKKIIKNYKEKGGTPWLDGRHTVFGYVVDGFDILEKIANQKTDDDDKPLSDVIIKTIEIIDKK